LRSIGWLVIVALPLAAHGAANVLQEYRTVLQSKPDNAHGEQLFAKCAVCHGSDGTGVQDGRIPAIADQHFRVIARQLVDFRHDKRWSPSWSTTPMNTIWVTRKILPMSPHILATSSLRERPE